MVANRYVTEYQATLLARGHADGFFLNEYKILDRLGKGRMAGVYKAQHHLGQVVAIKVLPPSKAKDADLLGPLPARGPPGHEAQAPQHRPRLPGRRAGRAALPRHGVPRRRDARGRAARAARSCRRHEAVRLVYQALQGLQHIHEQGLVHRDLKPANLMLVAGTPAGDTTLRLHGQDPRHRPGPGPVRRGRPTTPQDPGLTGEGVLLGTPDYMAPEQARDARAADIRADIYSLGCVLYHLLAGQPPFPDTNIISQMIRHATEPTRPLKEFNPAVPDGLQQILDWMMAKDPAGRYPTPERAGQALEMFLAAGAAAGLAAPTSTRTCNPTSAGSRSRRSTRRPRR